MLRRVLIVVALLALPCAFALDEKIHWIDKAMNRIHYPRRFAEVTPGEIYRAGFPTPRDIQNLVADKKIRTVLSLTAKEDKAKDRDARETVAKLRIRHLRIPMPGNGCGEFDDLDKAADAIHNVNNRPIFFHCNAGKQRSNAALAAYRMRHCAYSLKEALAELEAQHGLEPNGKERVLVDHLTEYWNRIQKRRAVRLGPKPPEPLEIGS